MDTGLQNTISPIGTTAVEASRRRAERSAAYRAEQDRLAELERIARLVICLRMDRGLTQREIADRVGTSHSAISRIESGQHKTSVETLRRIARAFDAQLVIGFERTEAEGSSRDLVSD